MSEKLNSNQLEQFVILSKSAKGAAAVDLIKRVTEVPGVYVFSELLQAPNLKELSTGMHAPYYNLLELFAYGTYQQYIANKTHLPDLSPQQITKLRHLTVVSLATKQKHIPYAMLLKELNIDNLRNLEDLIIEVIYADIVRGKLDQKNQLLEVDYAIGRDIRSDQIEEIISVLEQWSGECQMILGGIEEQMTKANSTKENHVKVTAQIEQEVANIKKTIKTTQQVPSVIANGDEQMITETSASSSSSASQEKSSKKPTKMKGLRGSGKLWK